MNKYALGLSFFVITSLYSAMAFFFFLFFFCTVLIIATSTRAKGNRHSCISYCTYKKKSPKHTHFGRFPCTLSSSLGDHLFPMNFESNLGDSFSRFEFGMQLNRTELL